MAEKFSIQDIEHFVKTTYNLQVTTKQLPGEVDLNFHLTDDAGNEYVLKLAKADEIIQNLDFQNKAIIHLAGKNMDVKLPSIIKNKDGEYISYLHDSNGNKRFIRIFSFIKGVLWADFKPHSNGLLKSLGKTLAIYTQSLQDFDHEALHRTYKWDIAQIETIKPFVSNISDSENQKIVTKFLAIYEEIAKPVLHTLRKGTNYNDANDYNILVDSTNPYEPKVAGFIDFGDMMHTYTISELAIALAYAMLNKKNPLQAAFEIIQAYHSEFPLEENEIKVLFPMIAGRLCMSVVYSAIEKQKHPENKYLSISEQPAWELLKKLKNIHPDFAHNYFRNACGLSANKNDEKIIHWIKNNQTHFENIIDVDLKTSQITVFDFSMGNTFTGSHADFLNTKLFSRKIVNRLDDDNSVAGIGLYNEIRPLNCTDIFKQKTNEGYEWRTLHLGMDIFIHPGSNVYAPIDSIVYDISNNNTQYDYGGLIILKHLLPDDLYFYTIYGHLNYNSISLTIGEIIKKGTKLGTIGNTEENGNWAPHLHFQICTDLTGFKSDFPGVALPSKKEFWLQICPNPNLILQIPDEKLIHSTSNKEEILTIRKNILGKNLSISYKKPLLIERGYSEYLFDENGRAFLDTVNNVAHVGHQHPKVVEAAQKQLSILNTNTRYLHPNIVNFASKLITKFPEPLKVCFFVNSGSEANELALRMARNYTKSKETIVVEIGYHGNTNAIIEISSYKFDGPGGSGALNHIHKIPIPDTYRGKHRNPKDAGILYASYVNEIIDKLKNEGKRLSAFICESVLSCGGQIVLPENYLNEIYTKVRQAGGLCIADEVQTGFGRVGSHYWAFETQNVIPDIVTMGKPIGNGHPLAAVVTTKEIADKFANGMEYFNTFGGNPVSCAIGSAVFDVIENEHLQQNALETGNFLISGLKNMMHRHKIIGDVRGLGLFLGFEMVLDRETLAPATNQATYLINRMKEHGILMSTDGPFNNVIKIKPPIVFNKENAEFLLSTLDKVLNENYLKI